MTNAPVRRAGRLAGHADSRADGWRWQGSSPPRLVARSPSPSEPRASASGLFVRAASSPRHPIPGQRCRAAAPGRGRPPGRTPACVRITRKPLPAECDKRRRRFDGTAVNRPRRPVPPCLGEEVQGHIRCVTGAEAGLGEFLAGRIVRPPNDRKGPFRDDSALHGLECCFGGRSLRRHVDDTDVTSRR